MIRPRGSMSSAAVAEHYDDLDWLYRSVWGEHVHHGLWLTGRESPELAARQLVDHVAKRARLAPGQAVCDVGCGYGATARRLARVHAVRVTGITLSRVQHAYAGSVRQQGVVIHQGDWLDNGLAPSSFDAVVAIESTEHMRDLGSCIAEVRRVLRPGGRAVVCAWLAAEGAPSWQQRLLLEPICREGRLHGLATATEYVRVLEQHGLRARPVEDLTQHVRRTWAVCIRRSLARLLTDPRARRYVLSPRHAGRQRVFLLTLFRIDLAYRTRALRYGVLSACRVDG